MGGDTTTTLATDRLVLRPLTGDDAAALHPALSDPDTLRHWHQPPSTSLEESQAFLRSTGDGYFAITPRDGDNTAIGFVGFGAVQANRQSSFGYLLHKQHWGRGIATEAARAVLDHGFSRRGIPAAELWIYDGNIASRRVAEKLGGVHRGVSVAFNLQRGVFDVHVYEIANRQLPPEVLRVIPVLQVPDVAAATAWYRDTLDFAVEWALDDPPVQASMTSPGWLPLAAVVRFQQGASAPTRLAFAVRDRIDDCAHAITSRGVDLLTPPTTFPWGMRRFEVMDPFGNTLVFETVDV